MIKAPTFVKFRLQDQPLVSGLAETLGVSTVLARILVNRGIATSEDANKFLHTDVSALHSPFLLKDMDVAVARIVRAVSVKERICVYGDYDVDGAVATALLMLFFQELGIEIDFYVPNRLTEGYSIHKDSLRPLKENGVTLVITVDNGISAHEAIAHARELGMDVIVTDHHQAPETLPPALAVVNPNRKDCSYPFKGICGAGVAYKLVMALRQRLREQNYFKGRTEPNLKQYLDLVCLATICDVVPLKDENRFFVKEGLKQLGQTRRVGLIALKAICDLSAKESLTVYDVGFRLGPRINACGRLKNADMGVRLLVTSDDIEATKHARMLDYLNRERQSVELKIVNDVLTRIERGIDLERTLGLVLYDPAWHAGVVGIVASRVVEQYRRPVFILCRGENGEIKGSGRSVPAVNLVACLADCSAHLIKYGGHEAAAGVTLDETMIGDFTQAFDAAVKKQMRFEDTVASIFVDDDVTQHKLDWPLMHELKLLEPHGVGNARPLFYAQDAVIKFKKIVGNGHLKLNFNTLGGNFDAIAFNRGDVLETLREKSGIVFGLEINKYREKENIQLVVKEFVS